MDISSFCQIDPAHLPSLLIEERHELPGTPAVYFALGENNQVLYIARSVSLNGKWKAHHRLLELERIGNVRLAWIELETEEILDEVEQVLIEHFSPVLNGQEVIWNSRAPVILRVPAGLLERANKAAKRLGINRTAFIVSSMAEKLERMEG